ncbi:hypothetical protein [Tunturiibacter gelidiferens]|uniref:hypothetical protein n=1 Tax=Tunturiibacter gelidiferens TaxID=3069689 RepID=UPI003D9AEF76
MKMHITTAALVLASAPAFSQSAMTGVSHPDSAVISSTDEATSQTPISKPSADVPAVVPSSPAVEYGPYVPYKGATVAGSSMTTAEPPADDPDAMIVTSVPERDGTLREGTLLKVQIKETLATDKTVAGSRFSATVTEAIERNGRVIIPVGSILEGRVTEVRGGRRITGAALMHLETNDVTLPDGTHYIVHAQLIDTGKSEFNVNNEGTLKRKDHPKETLAIVGGVTGAGAVTGALIGGGVGAVVGAGIGAGVSTVMWLKQDRQATLPKDAQLVFSLTVPMVLTPLSGSPVSSLNTAAVGGVGATR